MENLEFLLEMFERDAQRNDEGAKAAAGMGDYGRATICAGRAEAYKDAARLVNSVICKMESKP